MAQHLLEHPWAQLDLRRLVREWQWPELSIPGWGNTTGAVSKACAFSQLWCVSSHGALRTQVMGISWGIQKCAWLPPITNHQGDVISHSQAQPPRALTAS